MHCEFLGTVKWEDNFNRQGQYAFKNIYNGELKYVRPIIKVGDTLKIAGYKNYILVKKVTVNQIQDWDINKMTLEGKNSFEGRESDELYLNVLKSRYEQSWNANVKENEEELLYHNNPWVLELEIAPTISKNKTKTNRRKR